MMHWPTSVLIQFGKYTFRNAFLIGHYINYDIMRNMLSMHLKFGYFVLYTPTYWLKERKKRLHVQNCPCGTLGARIGLVVGLPVHGKVVVEFGRKVCTVDTLLWNTLNVAKLSITDMLKRFHAHENSKCNYSRKHNCDDVSKWRLHIRAYLGMMLAREYASCHAVRSTLVMIVANNVQTLRWPAKQTRFKSCWQLVGPIETQGSCTAVATKSQGAHACYSSAVCRSTTVYA